MLVEESIVIDRPIAQVWQFCAVDHVRNHTRWDPVIELWQKTEEPLRVGSIIQRRNSRGETPVEGTMEVVEFEPEAMFRVTIREGVETSGTLAFEALGGSKTRLTKGADMPWMDESLDTSMLRQAMQESLVVTKGLIES